MVENFAQLRNEIEELKRQKRAVIMAHYYTRPEIQEVADFLGDSLALSVEAQKCDADIILSCGKGVKDMLPQLEEYAKSIGGELAGSRGIVDGGYMPYSAQVGLTGRTVASAVYIAVGISGAVHHTCALDRVGTVIAINPDKDARIFEYADYGIIANAEDVFGIK